MSEFIPRYRLISEKIFQKKINTAKKVLLSCSLCPHKCKVNRVRGERGKCGAGAEMEVAHWQVHYGEEPPLSGSLGAGAIFFSHCNLHCVYCQNYQISRQKDIQQSFSCAELASIMLALQKQGAHNIDLVSPAHYLPMIIEAIYLAANQGLVLPMVYNTNGYESEIALNLLEGIIDVYLPDFKYSDEEIALRYSGVCHYGAVVKKALMMMYKQVGNFKEQNNHAVSGLIVRHLVLPENIAGSKEVLDFLKEKLGTHIGLSIMSQYAPCYKAKNFKELSRTITTQEYEDVVDYARKLGFDFCWIQELKSSSVYLPDFENERVFKD